jgi:hypothetical protein
MRISNRLVLESETFGAFVNGGVRMRGRKISSRALLVIGLVLLAPLQLSSETRDVGDVVEDKPNTGRVVWVHSVATKDPTTGRFVAGTDVPPTSTVERATAVSARTTLREEPVAAAGGGVRLRLNAAFWSSLRVVRGPARDGSETTCGQSARAQGAEASSEMDSAGAEQ